MEAQPETKMKLSEAIAIFAEDLKEHEDKYEDAFIMVFWLKDGTAAVIAKPKELMETMKEQIESFKRLH